MVERHYDQLKSINSGLKSINSKAVLEVDDRIQRQKNLDEVRIDDPSFEYSSGRDSIFKENHNSPEMVYPKDEFVTDPIKLIKSNLEAQLEKINKKKEP